MDYCNLNADTPPIKASIPITEIINSIQSITGKYFAVIDLVNLSCQSVSRSVMSDSATPWTVAHCAPLSMGFSRQEYWSG